MGEMTPPVSNIFRLHPGRDARAPGFSEKKGALESARVKSPEIPASDALFNASRPAGFDLASS